MNRLRADEFLRDCWQKQPLFLRQAVPAGLPQLDAGELAWLATLEDVESRIVFTERDGDRCRYRVQHGPFADEEIRQLPEQDWTLLVNDVEKHLPELRPLVDLVDFLPDWRLDDLMISFAVPGGGVGPHADNYDVFLCQGQGSRRWQYTLEHVPVDAEASQDLVLLQPFAGEQRIARTGDLLYLPPGVAHWGTAVDACLTYSVGMRAPRRSELGDDDGTGDDDPFYTDPDLTTDEVRTGYISQKAVDRALALLGAGVSRDEAARRLGCFVTRNKDWLRPDGLDDLPGGDLELHGMARLAWDDERVYLNGAWRGLQGDERTLLEALCGDRRLPRADLGAFLSEGSPEALVGWLLRHGAFEHGE